MNSKFFSDHLSPPPRKEAGKFPPLTVKLKDYFEKPSTACQDFENSSACRFFTHEDGKQTGRTTTRSTKYTFTRRKASSTHLNTSNDNGIVWELQERVDSFNIRYESLRNGDKSIEGYLNLTELCSNHSADLFKTAKIYYPDLAQVFNLANESVFKLLKEVIEFCNEEKSKVKILTNEMNEKHKEIKEKYENLYQCYLDMLKLKKIDELNIDAELNKIFPDISEEVNAFKERVKQMKEIQPEATCNILKDVYTDLKRERNMPEDPIADYSSMDPELITKGIKGNYQIIVNKTIKSVKKGMRASCQKSNASAQTDGSFIDSKVFEELNKTLDKLQTSQASTGLQLDRLRADLKNAQTNLEKAEQEKSNLRVELIGSKKDLENRSKDISALRQELENKKIEISLLSKQNIDKNKELERLDTKFRIVESERNELKRLGTKEEVAKIIQDSEMKLQKEKKEKNSKNHEETKEKVSSLDAKGKSGLTIREELEKQYNLQFPKPGSKVIEAPIQEVISKIEVPKLDSFIVPAHQIDTFEKKIVSNFSKSISTDKNAKNSEPLSVSVQKQGKKQKTKKKEEKTVNPSISIQIKPKKNLKIIKNFDLAIEKIDEEPSERYISPLTVYSPNNRCESRTKSMNTEEDSQEKNIENFQKSQKNFIKTAEKASGLDIRAEVSIGIQTNEGSEDPKDIQIIKFQSVNPNNIFGLRGDVFYQAYQFVPQPKLPDLPYPAKNFN